MHPQKRTGRWRLQPTERGEWKPRAAKSPAVFPTTASSVNPTYGDNVTITATVAAGNVLATPGGSVTFTDGTSTLATATLDGSLQATFSTSLFTAGTHPLVATFGGDTIFDVTPSTTLSIVVSQAPLTVIANNFTRPCGQANPPLTGTGAWIQNGRHLAAP